MEIIYSCSRFIHDGGLVMWPIIALSLTGLTVIFMKAIAFYQFFHSKEKITDPKKVFNNLQRGFGLVSTIITAEPMLGILGTVTGIIKTFSSFKLETAASPIAATAGIGEALITTAAGLVAALILLFPYNWLLGQLQKAADRLENEI